MVSVYKYCKVVRVLESDDGLDRRVIVEYRIPSLKQKKICFDIRRLVILPNILILEDLGATPPSFWLLRRAGEWDLVKWLVLGLLLYIFIPKRTTCIKETRHNPSSFRHCERFSWCMVHHLAVSVDYSGPLGREYGTIYLKVVPLPLW